MKKNPFASFCETFNQILPRNNKDVDRQISDCTKHLKICPNCQSVYEFRYPVGTKGSMRVFKYSQIPKLGFPKKTCQNCIDDTVRVEQY
jgi:hypothetical protein